VNYSHPTINLTPCQISSALPSLFRATCTCSDNQKARAQNQLSINKKSPRTKQKKIWSSDEREWEREGGNLLFNDWSTPLSCWWRMRSFCVYVCMCVYIHIWMSNLLSTLVLFAKNTVHTCSCSRRPDCPQRRSLPFSTGTQEHHPQGGRLFLWRCPYACEIPVASDASCCALNPLGFLSTTWPCCSVKPVCAHSAVGLPQTLWNGEVLGPLRQLWWDTRGLRGACRARPDIFRGVLVLEKITQQENMERRTEG